MTAGDVLLAEVIDNPDDDAPRLVLADWLGEHGEEARAEFIRVQIGLARLGGMIPPPRVDAAGRLLPQPGSELLRRERQLLMSTRAFEFSRFPDAMGEKGEALWRFERGFVARVKCPTALWLEHGAAVLALQPVTEVEFADGFITLDRHGDKGLCPANVFAAVTLGMARRALSGDFHMRLDRTMEAVSRRLTFPPRIATS